MNTRVRIDIEIEKNLTSLEALVSLLCLDKSVDYKKSTIQYTREIHIDERVSTDRHSTVGLDEYLFLEQIFPTKLVGLHAVGNDFQMDLSYTRQNGKTRIFGNIIGTMEGHETIIPYNAKKINEYYISIRNGV
jgi:hypothetical protein